MMFCSLALILGLFLPIGLSESRGHCSVKGIDTFDEEQPPFRLELKCDSADDTYLEFDQRQILRKGLKWPSVVKDSCKRLTVSGLQYIENGGFKGLEDIEWLSIKDNFLETIEDGMFENLDKLKSLSIGGNCSKIFRLENEAFHNLTTLVNLTLSNNSISNLQANVLKGLGGVTHLDLSHNDLNQLSPYSFSDLHSLENLQVQNNKLTRVSKRAFHNLTNLRFIDLRDNLIKVMEEPLFGKDEIPIVLDLTGNPLLCDCRMSWISSWLNISDRKIYGRCHAPEKKGNRSLAEVYAVVGGILQCYNDSVITHKVGTLQELPCSGIDCTWTTPDGRQLSEYGERQGPYILTNYDALVILDNNETTDSSINGSYTFVTSENETRVLTVNIIKDDGPDDGPDEGPDDGPNDDPDEGVPAVLAVILLVPLVILLVSLTVVLAKKPRETEEETSLICSDSSRSSRLLNVTQEQTYNAAKLIKSPSFMATLYANMDHSESSHSYSSPGPSSSPPFLYIKNANLDSESSNSDSENMF